MNLAQAYLSTEVIHINTEKEIDLLHEVQTPHKVNSTKNENIILHSIPINETATEQNIQQKMMQLDVNEDQKLLKVNSTKAENISLPNFLGNAAVTAQDAQPKVMQPGLNEDQTSLKMSSIKAENISLHSIPVNNTDVGQNVRMKMMQPNVISYPHEKEDIMSNSTRYSKLFETRFANLLPNVKENTTVDIEPEKHAPKIVFSQDFFKIKSDSRRNLRNLDITSLKNEHWIETGPSGKRNIRDDNMYPAEIQPILRKFFPEDFTTKGNHLGSNNFGEPPGKMSIVFN